MSLATIFLADANRNYAIPSPIRSRPALATRRMTSATTKFGRRVRAIRFAMASIG